MRVGDRIVIESKKTSQPARAGVIEEVLQESPARVLVRWEAGHSSILAPAAGVARITSGRARPSTAKTSSATKATAAAKPAAAKPKTAARPKAKAPAAKRRAK